jgi:lipopolysaccharide/colanic/teichoic acid biosynthesis glycosyltransferase
LEPPARARGAYADVALGGARKRIFDIVIAGIVLVVLAPMLLVTVGLIRVLIGKSAIVVKQWIGLGGKVFDAYQIRTAVESCEDASAALLSRNDHYYPASLGEALQASGLDKLPLLLNVLRGDMSLIGPRPIAPRELSRYMSQMPEYFTARPGLTGLWRHASAVTRHKPFDRMVLDRYYISSWSVWLDVTLLIEVISAGAKARWPAPPAELPPRAG